MLKHVRKHSHRLLLAGVLLSGLSWFLIQSTQAASIYLIPATAYSGTDYSMAVNNGNPVLSYWSQPDQSVMVAICANPACTTATTMIRPIENVPSIAMDINVVDDKPIVAYSELTISAPDILKIAVCLDPGCSQPPVIRTLDIVSSIGNVSVTLSNGKPLIVYDDISSDTAHNVVKLAICADATCATTPIIRRFTATDGINGNGGLTVQLRMEIQWLGI